jgi:cation transport ATPase
MALHPEDALVVRDGRQQRVSAATLVINELLIVKPGERIAADGTVAEGTSAVNQASITGESMLADKRVGDDVFAGTINGHGALRVNVTRPAGDTILARMIQLVQEAQERRPPAHLFIERFERGYAKVVVVGAIAVVALPSLAHWWTFREALYRAMIFLVVASPCALAAAMMPTLLSALSNGARNGILFKGSTFIESLGRVRAIAFDKTGTLCYGRERHGRRAGDHRRRPHDDDLEKIPYAVALGRQALRVVKQNLVLGLDLIMVLVVSDLLGWITLPWGVVGHEGSTLLVTLNGLRPLAKYASGLPRAGENEDCRNHRVVSPSFPRECAA